ncbi:MAG TPA: PEGA domain-containing protein, partial [Bacteroidota bacterium]|nr:PEGA domain-containing protein [Bacteroidota bacterium]
NAPGFSFLRLTATPWAKIFVDGRAIGETPMGQTLKIAAGKHSVTFTNPSFDPIVKEIDAAADSTMLVTADFMDRSGYLKCVVKPWADIFVDDEYKDTTPLSRPIMLPTGNHRIRFHHPPSADTLCAVIIKARDTLSLRIQFR